MKEHTKIQDLPRDNAARLAIYDAISEHARVTGTTAITDDELFEHVIGRLRVLVPRELHLAGDRPYVDEKIDACLQQRIIAASSDNGQRFLTLTGQPPFIRYPDGKIRDYSAGLESARERLDHDNVCLRQAAFDVRKFIPSIADEPDGDAFQELLESMREHGFMKQFPIEKYEDGEFVDGRARFRAATILHYDVEYVKYSSPKDIKSAHIRDTQLNRILVAIYSNIARLPGDVVDNVYKHVPEATGRTWDETAADLELTQVWRRSPHAEYTPRFDVKKLPYRKDDPPKIQVTADNKVMAVSLLQAGGLAGYKVGAQLGGYVPFEQARTAYSSRKADFARAEDLVKGISAMQQARQAGRHKPEPEWEQIRRWLVHTFKLPDD